MHSACPPTALRMPSNWLAALLLLCLPMAGHGASSLLIWPLAPLIEADQRATSLWLENLGKEAVTLQIRVLAWDQQDYRDSYQSQQQLIASPPFANIAPGARQLIRLTSTATPAAGTEQAFRILIDEIPVQPPEDAASATPPNTQSAALKFQMRYSLPLFVYGEGLWGKERPARTLGHEAHPRLSWQVLEEDGTRYLQVHNAGTGHARLSGVRLLDARKQALEFSGGLLGYVLPGRHMRWPMPEGRHIDAVTLQAKLGNKQTELELPRE